MAEPWSLDAERAVLGGVMLSAAAYHRVADTINEADFFASDHRALWSVLARLCAAGQPCDAVTVADSDPGLATLALECADSTPGVGSIEHYARIIAECAHARRVRAAGRQIAALERDRVSEAGSILAAAESGLASPMVEMREALRAWHAELVARYEAGSELTGVSTGLRDLDALTSGLQPADLIILAARPSIGKTAFMLHLLRSAAASGPVAVFSLEMPASQLLGRMVSSAANVGIDALRSPQRIHEDGWPRIAAATQRISELPIHFDESGNIGADAICARVRQLHAKAPLSMVCIDYLQLIRMEGENKNEAVGAVTRQLKLLAKAIKVPVVLLSQLNRSLEARSEKRPIMSDLRDSGSIEQDADLIVFLYRDEVYNKPSPDAGHTELIIAKHRNGPTGTVPVTSDLRFGVYGDCHALPSASIVAEDKRGFRRRA